MFFENPYFTAPQLLNKCFSENGDLVKNIPKHMEAQMENINLISE
jgi:hypothetical protein